MSKYFCTGPVRSHNIYLLLLSDQRPQNVLKNMMLKTDKRTVMGNFRIKIPATKRCRTP